MFGLSFTKLIVLGLAIFGAWQLFKWIERRGMGNGGDRGRPPAAPDARNDAPPEENGAVEMEQDPETGVWRPKE